MKKLSWFCLGLIVFVPLFSQVQVIPAGENQNSSLSANFYLCDGMKVEASNPSIKATTSDEKAKVKLIYPDGQISTFEAPAPIDIAVTPASYNPTPFSGNLNVAYKEIRHGFNSMVKGSDNGEINHFKMQFQLKGSEGKIKVQAGERECVPFTVKSGACFIENQEEALLSIHGSLENSSFYRASLDALCAELKKYAKSWDNEFKDYVLQTMNLVFTNEFFDPKNIVDDYQVFSVSVTICSTSRIKVTAPSVTVVFKGCMTFVVQPGDDIVIEENA